MLFNTILLNVAQHVSSLYKAHSSGALLLKLQLYYWYIKFLKILKILKNGFLRILYTNNIAVVISTKEPLKMSLI
jgi:hypothetical protein